MVQAREVPQVTQVEGVDQLPLACQCDLDMVLYSARVAQHEQQVSRQLAIASAIAREAL